MVVNEYISLSNNCLNTIKANKMHTSQRTKKHKLKYLETTQRKFQKVERVGNFGWFLTRVTRSQDSKGNDNNEVLMDKVCRMDSKKWRIIQLWVKGVRILSLKSENENYWNLRFWCKTDMTISFDMTTIITLWLTNFKHYSWKLNV